MASLRSAPLLTRLRPRAGCRLNGVAIALVLALIGAPAWNATRNECDQCPSTCPMHQHRDAGAQPAATHLGCHRNTVGASAHSASATTQRSPSVSCATCGHHGLFPATALPPVILPAPLSPLRIAVLRAIPQPPPQRPGRLSDPPDTPPPILLA
jgi:hypothetical protein